MNTERRNGFGRALAGFVKFILLRFLPVLLWGVFCTKGQVGAIVCTVCVGIIAIPLVRHFRNKERELTSGFEFYKDAYVGLTDMELVKIVIADERRSCGSKPVARRAVKLRMICTVVYGIVNALVMNLLYASAWSIPVGTVLFFVYLLVILYNSSLCVLAAQAKKQPDMPIDQLVRQEVFDDAETPTCKKAVAAGAMVFLLTLGCFFMLNQTERWSFEKTADGYAVTAYRPAVFGSGQVEIPAREHGEPVVAVGAKAFAGNCMITSVRVPDSVTLIEMKAFMGCRQLRQVELGQGLELLDSRVFKNCVSLESIQLPQSLRFINGECFMNCQQLESIKIPWRVTEIRGNTFEECKKLKNVTLHDGIVDIHAYAFRNCTSLEDIQLPPKITEIHTYTFAGCSSLKTVIIPDGVTRIAAHAFEDCEDLYDVFIPDTVMEIGSSAFRSCNSLETIALPEGVYVNERAFKESPTEIIEKTFTDEQIQKIQEELDTKESDVLYYVYHKDKGPDEIFCPGEEGEVVIADSLRMRERISDEMDLMEMNDEREVLAYLQKAKAAGMKSVNYCMYSKVATEIRGSTFITGVYWDIDDMIAECERKIAEFEK